MAKGCGGHRSAGPATGALHRKKIALSFYDNRKRKKGQKHTKKTQTAHATLCAPPGSPAAVQTLRPRQAVREGLAQKSGVLGLQRLPRKH